MVAKIKKQKNVQKMFNKKKLKFEYYKNCLQAYQFEKKCLEKNKIYVESLKEVHKKYAKNNKIILKSQQRFKSERHNFSTQEIYDKRLESIGSVET